MKNLFLVILLLSSFSIAKAQGGIPVWPLVTAEPDRYNPGSVTTTPHQYVDWDGGASLNIMSDPSAVSRNYGQTQAAFNDCGDLMFFAMHNGTNNANSLELFKQDGTPMTFELPGAIPSNPMNANRGDDEIQIVKRPGVSNQWYIIYSFDPVGFVNDQYIASLLAFSLIEVPAGSTVATYVLGQKDVIISAPPVGMPTGAYTNYTYIHGKAVSRTSVTATVGHDLFVQRRVQNQNNFSIDRFEVTNTGIAWNANSGTVNGDWWSLVVAGSPIELDPTESRLAVMERDQADDHQDVYIFDITGGTLSSAGVDMEVIAFDNLLIYPDAPNSGTTGYFATPGLPGTYVDANGFGAPNAGTYLSFLDRMEMKIASIEFSPSGQYLYYTGGGYVQSAYGNLTFLGQIDLDNPFGGNYIVRLQVQSCFGWDIGTYGRQDLLGATTGLPWSNLAGNVNHRDRIYELQHIARVQSCIDSNLYFTKLNSDSLYVIPDPNSPMPVSLVPTTVDLSTVAEQNVKTEGFVIYMPDQIDGYDYTNPDVSCCSAATDSLFTTVTDSITTDTYWDGKIYIPDNTIIVVDGVTLDITTSDVVFGQCSGIDFVNGAHLRANNSVFRPCSVNDTWRGVRFDGETDFSHQINENTFKNAEVALLFQKDAEGLINANTFSNCNKGVFVNGSLFKESIIANTFVTNKSYPDHTRCYTTTNPNDIIYIHIASSSFQDMRHQPVIIAQNNMVMAKQDRIQDVTAVEVFNGVASISENTMTNMTNAIVIQSPQGQTNIESNEIENNSVFVTIASSSEQISVWNASGPAVYINSNELKNNRDVRGLTRGAIFVSESINTSIEHNVIDGFDYGISAGACTAINISENLLSSIDETGIYFGEEGRNTNFITCNDVTMVMGQGVSIWTDNASENTQISSNCLKDGSEGIRTQGSGDIPVIRNNYLYNYQVGINNFGHGGNIGSSGDPGMNTLWSNNNAAFDVASSTSLDIADNFGMFNITWGTVNITSGNPYHSTASCGHQIFNMPSQGNLNQEYQCDNKDDFFLPAQQSGDRFDLPSFEDAYAYLSKADSKLESIYKIASLEDCSEDYLLNLTNSLELGDSDLNKVWFNYHKLKGNYGKAIIHLNNINDTRFVEVENLNMKFLSDAKLSDADLNLLATIANDQTDGLTNLAVTLSKLTANHQAYFYEYPVFEASHLDGSTNARINEDQTEIHVFPNPFKENVTIQVLEGNLIENQIIYVYDSFGKLVMERDLSMISGQVTLDLEDLSSGTYFVVLKSDEVSSVRTKIV